MNTVARMSEQLGRERHALGVVAGAGRDHAGGRSSAVSRAIRVYAPRILNDPVRCRFSHLRCTGPPAAAASARLCSSGVIRTTPSSSFRAARTSSMSTLRTNASPYLDGPHR